MGLDMFLTAHNYYSEYGTDESKAEQVKIQRVVSGTNGLRVSGVELDVGYWRKANAIHNWFVNNVQSGEDDCKRYYVDRGQLKELKELCERVLADHDVADDELPSQEGFFFGGTEYDEYYFNDLRDTVEIIDRALGVGYNFDFYYHASW